MATLLRDEEVVVRVTDIQRQTSVLNQAEQGPLLVIRDGDHENLTLVTHRRWQDAQRSLRWQAGLLRLLATFAARAAGQEAPYSSEFAWLEAFDREDVAEFVQELTETLNDVSDGVRDRHDLDILLYQWKRSAFVARDAALQARMAEARKVASL